MCLCSEVNGGCNYCEVCRPAVRVYCHAKQGPWMALLMVSVVVTLTLLNRLDRQFTRHTMVSYEYIHFPKNHSNAVRNWNYAVESEPGVVSHDNVDENVSISILDANDDASPSFLNANDSGHLNNEDVTKYVNFDARKIISPLNLMSEIIENGITSTQTLQNMTNVGNRTFQNVTNVMNIPLSNATDSLNVTLPGVTEDYETTTHAVTELNMASNIVIWERFLSSQQFINDEGFENVTPQSVTNNENDENIKPQSVTNDENYENMTSQNVTNDENDENVTLQYVTNYETITSNVSNDVSNDVTNDVTNFTAVVVLTYMRSGSSLTGDILEHHGGVFYLFEPLRALFNLHKRRKPISFMNGTVSAYKEYSTRTVSQQILTGWLTCNFTLINKESFLNNIPFLAFGKKTRRFNHCVNTDGRADFYGNWTMDAHCMTLLRQLCLESKYRVVKTIRTPMDVVKPVLGSIPGSKVIHLVRDPRATVLSQRKRRKCPAISGGVVRCGRHLCNRIISDSNERLRLQHIYPDQTLQVKYEDLVSSPSNTTRTIYSFLDMKYTRSIDLYVRKLTLGERPKGCSICQKRWQLQREKPSERVAAWQTSLSSAEIAGVQKWCRQVMRRYDYTVYTPSSMGDD